VITLKRWHLALLALVATAVVALPAGAGQKERIGERINLVAGTPATFPANQPFHIAHGWLQIPDRSDYNAVGKTDFTLEVDGPLVDADFIERASEDERLRRTWVHNFPEGLPAGTHTFTARWLGTCQSLVDSNVYFGTCTKPTERVATAASPLTRTIEFTP
jgi:hypothetical protein